MESIHEKDDTRSCSDPVPVNTADRNVSQGAKSLCAEHSPLPWRQDGCFDARLRDADGRAVADCGTTQDVSEANARLIATAVNSHEALVASCKELIAALAVAMRVISESDQADLPDCFVEEMAQLGIADGVGVRAQAALKLAEPPS